MTPEEELELIQIEQELRRRKVKPAAEGGRQSASASVDPSLWGGLKEVAGQLPQHARETAVQTGLAIPKVLAGGVDLITMGKQLANEQTKGGMVELFPKAETLPRVMPLLQALQTKLQGRNTEEEVPAAITEGMFSGPVAGPAMAAGAVSGGLTQWLLNAGVPPWVAIPAGVVTGGGTGAAASARSVRPGQILAQGRVRRALEGSDPGALDEAGKTQQLASERGLFILPSQGTGRQAPGLEQLETEAMLSHAKGGADLKQRVFQQAGQARELADELVTASRGTPRPADEAAGALTTAARERLLADQQRINSITQNFYEEAAKNNAAIRKEDLEEVLSALQGARREVAGNREVIAGIDDLLARLKNPAQEKAAKSEKLLRKLQGTEVQTSAPVLRRVYQSFIESLDAINEKTGARAYSDNVAGRLRELANTHVRKLYEKAEPLYGRARTMQADMLRRGARNEFDPLVQLSKASGKPENVTGRLLQPGGGDTLQEITTGVQRWLPAAERSGLDANQLTATAGASPQAARDALATALAQARDQAFKPSNLGATPPNAGAVLANAVAGTPAQQTSLGRAIAAVGGRSSEALKTTELLRALGRPTTVHGARVPGTEIAPIDPFRAVSPQPIQRTTAITKILGVMINKLSDADVIAYLNRPDSVQALQRLPGAKAMTPRMQLAALLAANAQGMGAGATQ